MRWPPSRLAEIARSKLIRERNDGGAQRPVFVRSLSPSEAGVRINPQREAHAFIMKTETRRREPPVPALALRGPG